MRIVINMKTIAVYAPDTIPLQGYGGADAPIYPNIAVLKKIKTYGTNRLVEVWSIDIECVRRHEARLTGHVQDLFK